MKTTRILLIAAFTAAAGYAAGLLTAPAKGAKTRRRLVRSAEDLASDLEEGYETAIDRMRSNMDRISGQFPLKATSRQQAGHSNPVSLTEDLSIS